MVALACRAWRAGASGVALAVGTRARAVLRPVALPRDHGAHAGFGVEWWYTAGTRAGAPTATGTSGLPPRGRQPRAWSSRVNLLDLGTGRVAFADENLTTTPTAAGRPTIPVGGS